MCFHGLREKTHMLFSVFIRKYPFSVPVEGANTTVHVHSNCTFKKLMAELADVLSVPPKDVKVAYRFSIEPRSAPWSHLKNSNDLAELFKRAFEATHKQKKQRSTRTFCVELKDLAPQSGNDDKTKGKNKSKTGPSGKKKKSRHNLSDSDDSEKEIDPSTIASKKKSASQWITELQKDNTCEEHPNQACIKFTTHHHQLSKNELGAWALFLRNGYTSTTQPPRQLKLGDQKPGESSKKTPQAGAASESAPYGFGPGQIPPMIPPLYPGYGYNPFAYHPPVMPPGFMPPQGSPYASSSSHRQYYGSSQQMQDNAPSSDPPDEVEDVTIFPRISDWLAQLDMGPRGVDGHNFAQFTAFFEQLKYIRICDIADNITSDALLAKCEDMADGTAQKIISYAKTDTHTIRRKEQKQRATTKRNRYY